MIQAFLGLTGPERRPPPALHRAALSPGEGPDQPEPRKARPPRLARPVQSPARLPVLPGLGEVPLLHPLRAGQYRRPEPDLFTGLPVQPGGTWRSRRSGIACTCPSGTPRGATTTEGRVLARIENLALLRYSGLLAQQVRSAAGLQAMLQDYFQLPVKVRQYQGQWLRIEPSQQSRLQDGGNNQLGLTTVIGERVWDIQSKFRLRIGPLGYVQFLDFLPDLAPIPERKALFLLVHLVRLYVGPALDFDVQLVLKSSEVPECQLEEGPGFGAAAGLEHLAPQRRAPPRIRRTPSSRERRSSGSTRETGSRTTFASVSRRRATALEADPRRVGRPVSASWGARYGPGANPMRTEFGSCAFLVMGITVRQKNFRSRAHSG